MHESDNFTLSRFPFPLVAMSFLSGLTANAALVGSWSRFLRPLLQFGSFCQGLVVTGGGEEKEDRLLDRI